MPDLTITLKEDEMAEVLALLSDALRDELGQKLEEAVRLLLEAATRIKEA